MSEDRKIEDGGPAFARSASEYGHGGHYEQDGMSLRDWFAGQFLAGASTSNEPLSVRGNASQEEIDAALRAHWSDVAHAAFIAADAFIAARKAGA